MPGEEKPCDGEGQPHDDADRQPRHGENMCEPRGDEGVPLRFGGGLVLAGEQGDGNRTGLDAVQAGPCQGDAPAI